MTSSATAARAPIAPLCLCSPHDGEAIRLAVRTSAAIFVAEQVLTAAGVMPEASLDADGAEDEDLSVFADFVESLDLDDLGDE